MIKRIWHGWTNHENADDYESLLKSEIFENIEGLKIEGFVSIELLRRELADEVEFVTIMVFDTLDSVREFAGADYEVAVVPPKAQALLSRYDAKSKHYTVKTTMTPRSWSL